MPTILKLSTALFFLLLLSSCQDVVQVKLDQGSKLYVIDAFINDLREPQTIRVSSNANYFSNTETPPVNNALVTLKDLSANVQYTFAFTSDNDGNYVFVPSTTDTIAKINHQYQLSVVIDGTTYTAVTTQKRAAGIDSIYTVYEDGNSGFGQAKKPYYRCELAAKDKVDANTDYYWVKTARNDTLFNAAGDLNIAIDGTGGAVTDFAKDSVSFTPPATFLSFKRYQAGDKCTVQIHSITLETYNFLQQSINQIDNGGLFALTPENVKTNIVTPKDAKTKCIGWFSVATVVSKSKIVP